MKDKIFGAIKQYRAYVATANMLEQHLKLYEDPERRKQFDKLTAKKTVIESWFGLLTDDELYVIKRHIMDGLSWSRLQIDYAREWGLEFSKSDRMLKKHQVSAIAKMVEFSENHGDLVNDLLAEDSTEESVGDADGHDTDSQNVRETLLQEYKEAHFEEENE